MIRLVFIIILLKIWLNIYIYISLSLIFQKIKSLSIIYNNIQIKINVSRSCYRSIFRLYVIICTLYIIFLFEPHITYNLSLFPLLNCISFSLYISQIPCYSNKKDTQIKMIGIFLRGDDFNFMRRRRIWCKIETNE